MRATMKNGMTSARLLVAVGMMMVTACGATPKGDAAQPSGAPPKTATAEGGGGGAASAAMTGAAPSTGTAPGGGATPATSAGSAAASAPVEKPFAKTPEEATTMIDEAVTSRAAPLSRCVEELRTRKKDVHAKVTVEIGIDQEGHLLGVKTPKGHTEDKALNECVQTALRGAPFPRSHSGVITLKKTFEDTVVYR
jgi:hypothetical protein